MSATRPVKSTDYFKSMPDYQEAQQFQEKYAHIGSLNLPPLKEMRDKVITKGVNADCFGDFFCPERTGDWSYEKNQAFMAGAIDANRAFILVTDIIEGYQGIKAPRSGTVKELLWLKDNGYTFEPHPNNIAWTIAKPPEKPLTSRIIDNYGYYDKVQSYALANEIINKLHEIKEEVLQKRKEIQNKLNPSDSDKELKKDSEKIKDNTEAKTAVSMSASLSASSSVSSSTSSSTSLPPRPDPKNTNKYIPPGRREDKQTSLNSVSTATTKKSPASASTSMSWRAPENTSLGPASTTNLTKAISNIPSVSAPTVSMRQTPFTPHRTKPKNHQ